MNSRLSSESGYAIYITITWNKRNFLEITEAATCIARRAGNAAPGVEMSDRRISRQPKLVAQSSRRTKEDRRKEQSARIQRHGPQLLHVMQFRRRTSKHCRRPRAKTLALLRPEATLYVACVISREGIKKTLRRLGGFRCSTRTFDLRPLCPWRKLRFRKHVALKYTLDKYISRIISHRALLSFTPQTLKFFNSLWILKRYYQSIVKSYSSVNLIYFKSTSI